ncbi:hypothetical protein YC2023_016286 [Brassica napus]
MVAYKNFRQWLEEEMCFFNLSSSGKRSSHPMLIFIYGPFIPGQFSEMKNLNQWKHKFMFYCRYFISVSPRLNFLLIKCSTFECDGGGKRSINDLQQRWCWPRRDVKESVKLRENQ